MSIATFAMGSGIDPKQQQWIDLANALNASRGGFGGFDPNGYADAYAQKFAPKTVPELMGEVNQGEAMVPAHLQMSALAAQLNPTAAIQDYYNNVGQQAIAQAMTNAAAMGRDNSTFGAADVAMTRANVAAKAYQAGQDYMNNTTSRFNAARNAFFSGLSPLASKDKGYESAARFGLAADDNALNRQKWAYQMEQNQPDKPSRMAPWINMAAQAGPSLARGVKSAWSWVSDRMSPSHGAIAPGGKIDFATGQASNLYRNPSAYQWNFYKQDADS